MKHIGGGKIFQEDTMITFFTFIKAQPRPDLFQISPVQAFGAYVARCGGDPERTIIHFTLVVPELCGPMTIDQLALLGLE